MCEVSLVMCAASSSFVYIQSQPKKAQLCFVWGYFLELGKYDDTQPRGSLGPQDVTLVYYYLPSHEVLLALSICEDSFFH